MNRKFGYEDRIILVTGGTGSIGRFVVKGLLDAGAQKVIVLGRTESKHEKLDAFVGKDSTLVEHRIGDVRNYQSVFDAMVGCDLVFHIAAMKYVPFCEENVYEAVCTNIIGAQNVRNACINNNIGKIVVVSTDKAAEPRGIMGMTKYIQERLFLNPKMPITKVVTTRFGNVLGSEGSVVWKFKEQADKGEPITLTSLEMSRFVMTPNEAAELVLWSGLYGNDADIVIRKMMLCKIVDLAKVIAPNASFVFTGIRPGEKLDETLLNTDEIPFARMVTEKIIVISRNHNFETPYVSENYLTDSDIATSGQIYNMMKEVGVL